MKTPCGGAAFKFIQNFECLICIKCNQAYTEAGDTLSVSSSKRKDVIDEIKGHDTSHMDPKDKGWMQIVGGQKKPLFPDDSSNKSTEIPSEDNIGNGKGECYAKSKPPAVNSLPHSSMPSGASVGTDVQKGKTHAVTMAVNDNNENPMKRTLGCFLSRPFVHKKADGQQANDGDGVECVSTNQPSAISPQNLSTPTGDTVNRSRGWSMNPDQLAANPSQNFSTPNGTNDKKKPWHFGGQPSRGPKKQSPPLKRQRFQGQLPLHVGPFNPSINCYTFDHNSFPNCSNETGASILLKPIVENIFGNPNPDAINGQVLVCLSPRTGCFFICLNNNHNNNNGKHCQPLVTGNKQQPRSSTLANPMSASMRNFFLLERT